MFRSLSPAYFLGILLSCVSFWGAPAHAYGQEPAAKEVGEVSALLQAAVQRLEELSRIESAPKYQLHDLCDGRVRLIAPINHDLQFHLPTLVGESASKASLAEKLESVFAFLDEEFMLATEEQARQRMQSAVTDRDPILLLLIERVEDRKHFNVRYPEGVLLEDLMWASLRPFDHDACSGVPGSHPGTCGDIYNCRWETHFPLCEFVNRVTAEVMERRYGKLPPVMTGFAEVLEWHLTGAHYAYRHWDPAEAANVRPNERDGYDFEFDWVLEEYYTSKEEREKLLLFFLEWDGSNYDPVAYSVSWGFARTFLGHLRETGRGKKKKTLGDLLCAFGENPEATPQERLEILEDYDSKFMTTLAKKLSKKDVKAGLILTPLIELEWPKKKD